MAIDFPAAPAPGQEFTSGGTTWVWDGAKWSVAGASGLYLPLAGGTLTGPLILDGDPTAQLGAVTLQMLADIPINAGIFP